MALSRYGEVSLGIVIASNEGLIKPVPLCPFYTLETVNTTHQLAFVLFLPVQLNCTRNVPQLSRASRGVHVN